MLKFKIRNTGNNLASLPFYNTYGGGDYNAFHEENAPLSVGGSMSDLANKESKGNCTWYAFGRYQEVFGVRVPYELRRGNAGEWTPNSQTPKVGSIVIFDDGDFGHVAFVENIVGDDVIVSESVYSTRGNDVLHRYGRTVKEICNAWGMSVKGYIAPAEACVSYDEEDTPNPAPSVPTPTDSKVGKILVVRRHSYHKELFTAYADEACTIPLAPWTLANYDHDLTFYIAEDLDPVFKCKQWSLTPMSGIEHVYIKWESGIGFDEA